MVERRQVRAAVVVAAAGAGLQRQATIVAIRAAWPLQGMRGGLLAGSCAAAVHHGHALQQLVVDVRGQRGHRWGWRRARSLAAEQGGGSIIVEGGAMVRMWMRVGVRVRVGMGVEGCASAAGIGQVLDLGQVLQVKREGVLVESCC